MKKKKIVFLVFALVIVLVPVYVIMNSQDILENGTYYKFRPQAYDPIDPVRGHYLRINYDIGNIPTEDNVKRGDDVFVSIGVDEKGFAFFKEVFKNKPKKGDYLAAKVSYIQEDRRNYQKTVSIEAPDHMCKYYINEDYGLAGEIAFRNERENAYIGVRIQDGIARIQDIYLRGKPIMEYLKKK